MIDGLHAQTSGAATCGEDSPSQLGLNQKEGDLKLLSGADWYPTQTSTLYLLKLCGYPHLKFKQATFISLVAVIATCTWLIFLMVSEIYKISCEYYLSFRNKAM